MQLGYGRREAVEHLLAMGANVLARDDGGLIPLHNACSFGHAEVSLFYFLKTSFKESGVNFIIELSWLLQSALLFEFWIDFKLRALSVQSF